MCLELVSTKFREDFNNIRRRPTMLNGCLNTVIPPEIRYSELLHNHRQGYLLAKILKSHPPMVNFADKHLNIRRTCRV